MSSETSTVPFSRSTSSIPSRMTSTTPASTEETTLTIGEKIRKFATAWKGAKLMKKFIVTGLQSTCVTGLESTCVTHSEAHSDQHGPNPFTVDVTEIVLDSHVYIQTSFVKYFNFPTATDKSCKLLTDSGKEYSVEYLGKRQYLSAGWRKVVEGEGIKMRDRLLFYYLGSYKFKMWKNPSEEQRRGLTSSYIMGTTMSESEKIKKFAVAWKGMKIAKRFVERGLLQSRKRYQSVSSARDHIPPSTPAFSRDAQGELRVLYTLHVDVARTVGKSHVYLPDIFVDSYGFPTETDQMCKLIMAADRKEYFVKYLGRRHGLSAGWSKVLKNEHIEEGDAVHFHYLGEYTFNVDIEKGGSTKNKQPSSQA